jgi:plasmid maintenance system antidote protein VapI
MEQINLRNRLIKFKETIGTTNQFVANAISCDRSTISKFTTGKDLPIPLSIRLDKFITNTIDKLNTI